MITKCNVCFLRVFVSLFLIPIFLSAGEFELEFDASEDANALPSALLKFANEVYDINLKGLDALELGKIDQAMEYFDRALELLPTYTDAENNRAVVYFRKGNIGLAEQTWKKIVARDPQYAISYYNLGIIAYNERNNAEAREYLQKSITRSKQFVEGYVLLGRIGLAEGNIKDALAMLRKAYGINPAHQGAWSALAYAYVLNGDTVDAEKILLTNKKDPVALKMLGQITASRGKEGEAVEYLRASVAQGGDKETAVDIAQVQLDMGECTEALSTIQTYIGSAGNPGADAWLLAGVAAKECGTIAQSKRYFEQGVSQYPHDPVLRYNLGQVYFYQKEYDDADKIWSKLSDTTGDPGLYYLRAIAAKKRNDLALAENYVNKALALDLKAEYLDLFGLILYEQGKQDDAVVQFRKAIALNPSLQSPRLNLALCGKTDKDVLGAIAEAKKQIVSCTDDCPGATLQLSILYYHARQFDKAIEVLNKLGDDRKDKRIYRHLAVYYKAQAEWQKAIGVLERARALHVFDTQMEYELAEAYSEAGFYSKAISGFQDLLTRWDKDLWRLYYQLGYAFTKQQEFAQAQHYLELSLKEKKNNTAARSLLAFIHNERGETEKARSLWEKTLKEDPSNQTLWINMGLLLQKDGKYAEALEKFQYAASLTPANSAVYINIGNVYEQMEQLSKAMSAYEKALASDKREIAAYNVFTTAKNSNDRSSAQRMFELLKKEFSSSENTKRVTGEMLLWQGDTAKGCAVIEALSKKIDDDWHTLAMIYASQGKKDAANTALAHLPDMPRWNKVKKTIAAKLAFNDGSYKEALNLYQQQPDTSYAIQYNMALAAFHAEEYAVALRVASTLVPRSAGEDKVALCRLIGNISIKTKDWKNAVVWFSQLAGLRPRDGAVAYNIAVAHYNLGNTDLAWEWYQKARSIDSTLKSADIENKYTAAHAPAPQKEAEVFDNELDKEYNRAVTLQQQGKNNSAEALYKQILAKNPQHYLSWNNLGALYGARAQFEKAIECYKNSVLCKNDLADGYANLVNIYIALGDYAQAEKWLVDGKLTNPDSDVLLQMEVALTKAKKGRK